jgi:hypothetical protein
MVDAYAAPPAERSKRPCHDCPDGAFVDALRRMVEIHFAAGRVSAVVALRLQQCGRASKDGLLCPALVKWQGTPAFCVQADPEMGVLLYDFLARLEFKCPAGHF